MSAPNLEAKAEIGLMADASALPADLTRALDWLRAHLSEPVELSSLAAVSGVPPRTLERHFRMFLGTTPLGWVRSMRLIRARHALLNAGPDDTITSVALTNGFGQLGRFAAEYRRAFGELPSRTMRQSKNPTMDDGDLDEAMRLTLLALPFAFAVAPKQCNAALEKPRPPSGTGAILRAAEGCGLMVLGTTGLAPVQLDSRSRSGFVVATGRRGVPARAKRHLDAYLEQRRAGAGAPSRGGRPAS
jgi:AraC-like DNA-binding protein